MVSFSGPTIELKININVDNRVIELNKNFLEKSINNGVSMFSVIEGLFEWVHLFGLTINFC